MGKEAITIEGIENHTFAISVYRRVFNDENIDGDIYIDGVLAEIAMLRESEQAILRMRYSDGLNFREIADEFQTSRDRIRKIEEKIILKLKHISRIQKMRVSYFLEQNDSLKSELTEKKEAYDITAARCEIIESMLPTEALAQLDKEVKARSFNNTPIVELSISIRLYNCLANAGIADIGGILALKTYGDIREIRHLGKKCAHELIGVMRGMGYDDWADEIVSTKKRSTPQNLIH